MILLPVVVLPLAIGSSTAYTPRCLPRCIERTSNSEDRGTKRLGREGGVNDGSAHSPPLYDAVVVGTLGRSLPVARSAGDRAWLPGLSRGEAGVERRYRLNKSAFRGVFWSFSAS